MRLLVSVLLLTAFFLSSCAQSPLESPPATPPPPASSVPSLIPAFTRPSPTSTATSEPPIPTPGLPSSTPTATLTATSAFTHQPVAAFPLDRPLLAYQTGSSQDKSLFLADPAEGRGYEFPLPASAHSATPFLAGLSPDARYLVYFEGGTLETLYGVEHLRISTPDLLLKVLDLRSGEVIFSTPLLNPAFPQDLAQIAEKIKDDWHFTSQNATFEDVMAATQEMMLDHIREIAWSPDSSLLAYAAQVPGPSSDLYFFSPASRTARRASSEAGHVLQASWAPDSSALVLDTSLYDRMAREDTTDLLSRNGSLLASLTSQVWFFSGWHDSTYAFLSGGTDAGDYFELKAFSVADGKIHMIWEGTYAEIAFSPDRSTFLLSSNMPTAPTPAHAGLYLGRRDEGALRTLSNSMGWGVAYWGSERFAFAASSLDEGTIGITPDGDRVTIDSGDWNLAPSPDGEYLVGYHRVLPGYLPGIIPGLRIFNGNGRLLETVDGENVTCVGWNAASSALAYQVEGRLYLWEAASGVTRLVADQLDADECAFEWVRDSR